MKINLTPQRSEADLTISKTGDALTINAKKYDFSALTEGDILPRGAVENGQLASDVTRINGEIQLTLVLPIPASHVNDPAASHPAAIVPTIDGQIALPVPSPDIAGPVVDGVIDWSQVVTSQMQSEAQRAIEERLVRAEAARRLEALAAGYTREERETWGVQIAEAAAVQAGGDATAAPMLAALAAARGITLAEMAVRVQALSAQLTAATATILAAQATLLAMAPIPQDFTADTWWVV